jgi:hypothetical protein
VACRRLPFPLPARAGLELVTSERRAKLTQMSWYIEVELLGRVVHEVAVSDSDLEAMRCYRSARAQWRAGKPIALELADNTRLASYLAEDVTGLRLLASDQRLVA